MPKSADVSQWQLSGMHVKHAARYIFYEETVKSLHPETLDQLAERWTVLINQIKHHEPRFYPGALCNEVNGLIQQTEHIADPRPLRAGHSLYRPQASRKRRLETRAF